MLELLAAQRRRVEQLWVTPPKQHPEALQQVLRLAEAQHVPVRWASPEELGHMAGTSAHQGVVAWARPVVAVGLDTLVSGPAPFLVILDGVTDPGNFGAILRTAACAGVTGMVMAQHRAAPLTPAAVKAAAGAIEHVPIAVVPGVPAALQQLSRAGLWSVGLAPDAGTDLWSTPVLDGPVAVVLGAEGRGLSALARQRCDVLARISQAGPLGSLNVAAAGAVACFEVARRRQGQRLGQGQR